MLESATLCHPANTYLHFELRAQHIIEHVVVVCIQRCEIVGEIKIEIEHFTLASRTECMF